jgi:septum formation topological specificity factor MinE
MDIYRQTPVRSSAQIAKIRAEQTVSSDRLSCMPEELQQMKQEIVNILSRYLVLDETVSEIRVEIVHEIKQGVPYVKTVQIK